jgi:hypothetical protein
LPSGRGGNRACVVACGVARHAASCAGWHAPQAALPVQSLRPATARPATRHTTSNARANTRELYTAAMTPTEAIIANFNKQLGRWELLRAFLAHPGWRVARPRADAAPTIIVSDEAFTAASWIFSCEEAYQAACKEFTAEAVGSVSPAEHLDEVIAMLDPRVVVLRIDPGYMIALHIQTDELAAFKRFARCVRIERAMADNALELVRRHDGYYVPYYGVLGEGHQVIALPTERGSMIAAFTAEDAVDQFLATGSAENRARVKFVQVDGDALFAVAAPQMAEGVIVNIAGPRTFGFDLARCRDVASA